MRKILHLKLSFLGKFSLLSFVILAIIAIALTWFIQQRLEESALLMVADHAAGLAPSILEPHLSSSDFISPIDPERYAQLDTLIRKNVITQGHIVRINIWDSNGKIIYSEDAELVGRRFPLSEELEEALAGKLTATIFSPGEGENRNEQGSLNRLIEVYVPIRLSNSSQVVGVYEIFHELAVIAPRILEMKKVVGTGILIGFILLYISLFTLVRSVSNELSRRNEENARLYREATHELAKREVAEKDLQRNFQIQTVLSTLLNISLSNISLDEQLQKILEHILSIPWLTFESKGCILLVEDDPKVLVLKAHQGLPDELLSICARVRFGRCMCGRAASSGVIEFSERINIDHENRYKGISPHGHYCVPILSMSTVLGVINLYLKEGHQRDEKEEAFLRAVSDVLAGVIERYRAGTELEKTVEKLRNALGGTIKAMAMTVESRDPYTAGHQIRVADLARAIAAEMGLREGQIDNIRMAGVVHDLGKISIPAEILSKPSRLNDLELAFIKTHPQAGFEILKATFPWPIPQIVLQHHERIDGSGYPSGLSGKDILLEARILAVADVVEAMASHRPYRPSLGIDKALDEITHNRGIYYDPKVVDACLALFKEKGFQFKEH